MGRRGPRWHGPGRVSQFDGACVSCSGRETSGLRSPWSEGCALRTATSREGRCPPTPRHSWAELVLYPLEWRGARHTRE